MSEARKYPSLYRHERREYVIFYPKHFLNNATLTLAESYDGVTLLPYTDSLDTTPNYIISIKKACRKMISDGNIDDSQMTEIISILNEEAYKFFEYQHMFKKPEGVNSVHAFNSIRGLHTSIKGCRLYSTSSHNSGDNYKGYNIRRANTG
jgi:hypothetical protein